MVGRWLGSSGELPEVALREGNHFRHRDVADEHQRGVVRHEVVIVDLMMGCPSEVSEVPHVPAIG